MIFGRFVHGCTKADGNLSSRLGSGELDGLDLVSLEFGLQQRRTYVGKNIDEYLIQSNWVAEDKIDARCVVRRLNCECNIDVVGKQFALKHLQCPAHRVFDLCAWSVFGTSRASR